MNTNFKNFPLSPYFLGILSFAICLMFLSFILTLIYHFTTALDDYLGIMTLSMLLFSSLFAGFVTGKTKGRKGLINGFILGIILTILIILLNLNYINLNMLIIKSLFIVLPATLGGILSVFTYK